MTLTKVKLYVIVDNEANEGFLSDWGLSIFIETNEWIALFDAGGNVNVFKHNAERLGIDLAKLNFAFLSHHHGDHYGGFKYLGKVKPLLKVYVPPGSIDYLISWGLKPVIVSDPIRINDNVWSTGPLRASLWGIR